MDRRQASEGARPVTSAESSRPGLAYVVTLAAALTLYLISMAPGVLWQDSGLAQVRVLQRDLVGDRGLALSHPLYYVLAIAFQALPFADSAFKTNLVSALFGAVTVANVFLLVQLVTRQRGAALVGAISLAVAHTFWQHCALAEVYTVSTALLSAELLCLYEHASTGKPRWLVLLFLCNGFGVSNHMLAVLSLACYAVLMLWLLWRGKLGLGMIPLLVSAWIVGAGLYGGLIVAQLVGGAALGPTVHSALFGASYAGNVLNLLPNGKQLLNSVLYLGLSFPTPAVLLVIPGLAAPRRLPAATLRATLLALLAVHLVWAVRYDVPDQYTFFIPSLVLLAIVIGCGAARFLESRPPPWRIVLTAAALLPAIVYVPLPRVARAAGLRLGLTRTVPYRDEYTYFLHPWKTGYRGPERFARELRESLPENGVLVADGTTVRPIHYFQQLRRWRDDVRVFPPLQGSAEAKEQFTEPYLADQLAAGQVYVVTPQERYCPGWLLERYEFVRDGLVYRVTPAETSQQRPSGVDGAP